MFYFLFEELAYRASKLPFEANDYELIKAF